MPPIFKQLILPALAGSSIIMSYDWIRIVATPIFLEDYEKDLIPLATTLMIISIVPLLYLYNKTLSKFGAQITFQVLNIGWILVFVLHYFLISAGVKQASFSLYVLRPIYVMMLIEQVWAYFNTVNNLDTAKIYAGWMMGIVSIGTILSGKYLQFNVKEIGTLNALLIGSLFLIPASLIMYFLLKGVKIQTKNKIQSMGLKELKSRPTLYALFFIILLSQVFTGITQFQFDSLVSQEIPLTDDRSSYYAGFYANINIFASVIQFILMPIVLSKIFLGHIHIIIPIINFLFACFILLNPGLQSVMLSLLTFKAIDYSMFKGAKELIYIPLTTEIKYRTKQFIDVFGYRLGTGGFAVFFAIIKPLRLDGNWAQIIWDFAYKYSPILSSITWICLGLLISKYLRRNPETQK